MRQRLKIIQEQRKLQGVKWKELAENLPISAEGLRIAFSRESVDPTYLKIIEEKLGITKPTTEETQKTPLFDARFEDVIAKQVAEELKPFIQEKTDDLLQVIMNMQIELSKIRNEQAKTLEKQKETFELIEKRK